MALSLTADDFREIARIVNGGNTWFVRKTGNDTTGDGKSPSTAYLTIGKALSVCATGDTIDFLGAYTEELTVDKYVHLKGHGQGCSAINAVNVTNNEGAMKITQTCRISDCAVNAVAKDDYYPVYLDLSGGTPFNTGITDEVRFERCLLSLTVGSAAAQGNLAAIFLQAGGGPHVRFIDCTFDSQAWCVWGEDLLHVFFERCQFYGVAGCELSSQQVLGTDCLFDLRRRGSAWTGDVVGVQSGANNSKFVNTEICCRGSNSDNIVAVTQTSSVTSATNTVRSVSLVGCTVYTDPGATNAMDLKVANSTYGAIVVDRTTRFNPSRVSATGVSYGDDLTLPTSTTGRRSIQGNLTGSVGSLATQAKTDVTAALGDFTADGVGLANLLTKLQASTYKTSVTDNGDGTYTVHFLKQDGTTTAYSITYNPTTGART